MASVSKQVTAMALLLLVEDGLLGLDDPARKFIPELPPYADKITVAQILNHTSGLRDYLTLGELNGYGDDHVYTEGDVLGLLDRQQGLNFDPGSEFLYSNSGYVLASMIVHRVSGQRLDDFARARIFTPLGMNASRFQHDHTQPIPDKATGYVPKGAGWAPANSFLDVTGDGGLYSTVEDMLKWLANLDSGAVGAKAVTVMRASAKLNDGSPSGYGMGLSTGAYRGLEVVQHGGALAGYRTADWWFPGQKLGVVVLCNNSEAQTGEMAGDLAAVFLAGEMAPPPGAAPARSGEDARPYAGLYRDRNGGYAEFAVEGGGLVALTPNRALVSIGPGQFVLATDPAGVRYVFDTAADQLNIVREGQPTRRLQRVERSSPTPSEAAPYLGDYASSEVSSRVHIRRAAGLTISIGDSAAVPLVSTGKDRLWAPLIGTELIFVRDAAGGITGLTLNAGRARGLKYVSIAS
jgi:CubicO group peptidase (beta-lactamase class C family)